MCLSSQEVCLDRLHRVEVLVLLLAHRFHRFSCSNCWRPHNADCYHSDRPWLCHNNACTHRMFLSQEVCLNRLHRAELPLFLELFLELPTQASRKSSSPRNFHDRGMSWFSCRSTCFGTCSQQCFWSKSGLRKVFCIVEVVVVVAFSFWPLRHVE